MPAAVPASNIPPDRRATRYEKTGGGTIVPSSKGGGGARNVRVRGVNEQRVAHIVRGAQRGAVLEAHQPQPATLPPREGLERRALARGKDDTRVRGGVGPKL